MDTSSEHHLPLLPKLLTTWESMANGDMGHPNRDGRTVSTRTCKPLACAPKTGSIVQSGVSGSEKWMPFLCKNARKKKKTCSLSWTVQSAWHSQLGWPEVYHRNWSGGFPRFKAQHAWVSFKYRFRACLSHPKGQGQITTFSFLQYNLQSSKPLIFPSHSYR